MQNQKKGLKPFEDNFSNDGNLNFPTSIVHPSLKYSSPYDNHSDYQKALIGMRSEIENLIDFKISENTLKFLTQKNEQFKALSKDIDDINLKISNLEETKKELPTLNFPLSKDTPLQTESEKKIDDKLLENDSPTKYINQESQENENQINIYKEEVDIDTYLYFSLAFSFTALPLIFGYIYVIFFKSGISLLKRMTYLLSVILSPLLLVPGLATPCLQLFCIYYVYEEALEYFDEYDEWTYYSLKILIIVIFVFMVAKETGQAINSFFFCFLNTTSKGHYFLAGCFLPPILQFTMAFLILYVGFLLIVATDDPVNLIQNFASVYVLLEIDNILMSFLKLSKISIFIIKINGKLDILRANLGIKAIFKKDIIMKVLIENSLEIDYKNEEPIYRTAFLLSRGILMVILVIFSVLVWIYGIEQEVTHHKKAT